MNASPTSSFIIDHPINQHNSPISPYAFCNSVQSHVYSPLQACQGEKLVEVSMAQALANGLYDSCTSSDEENVNRGNHFVQSTEDREGEAVSGIAAMSLSFIINGDLEEQLDDDDGSSSTGGSSRGGFDLSSMLNIVCAKPECYRTIRGPTGTFCKYHKQSRFCRADNCNKSAKTGGYCISHGGGKRCAHPECNKSAKQGGLCISHGGGKRCSEAECTKSALVGGFCSAHGGGRKCKMPECTKTALLGGLCIAHGGGKRCQIDSCSKSAVGGTLCVSHGGGKRCQAEGCNKGAVRNGVCIRHGAKRDSLVAP